jgi:hypothetical protein
LGEDDGTGAIEDKSGVPVQMLQKNIQKNMSVEASTITAAAGGFTGAPQPLGANQKVIFHSTSNINSLIVKR